MNHSLVFQCMLAALFISSVIGFGVFHEQVHVSINSKYGIKSEVYYFKNFPDFSTESSYQDFHEKCNDTCKQLHSINEVLAYHLLPIYAFLGLCLIILLSVYFDVAMAKYHTLKKQYEQYLNQDKSLNAGSLD